MKVLKGLDVASFAHPDDQAVMKALASSNLNNIIEQVSDIGTRYKMEMQLMGMYVRLNREDMPELYQILEEVCRTLDYPKHPIVFMYRNKAFDWQIYIGNEPVIILTDYVLNEFDFEMLRFHLGCAVTALKASTSQVRVASKFALPFVLSIPIIGQAAAPLLTKWSRAAALTEDRGGLLACQNEKTAWRYMMRRCGIPLEMIDESIVSEYLAEYKPVNEISSVSKLILQLDRLEPWQNERFIQLFQWYNSGAYADILEDY